MKTTPNGYIEVTFPAKTAREIVDECGNKVGEGKLVWDTEWYADEGFYTKEKCRPGTRLVSVEPMHKGKTNAECAELLKTEGAEMMNLAEALWFLKTLREKAGEYPAHWYTWTSSRSSDGRLVYVGNFDSRGVYVYRWPPDSRDSSLGACSSRT